MVPLAPGLFGKMPAHGDFVRRGWDDATVDALDRWCGDTLLLLGEGDRGENTYHRDTPVRFWTPAGTFGAAPVHFVIAPSRDRAGRDFVLVVGVAGAGAWTHTRAGGDVLEAALRAAVAGELDADATVAALAALPIEGADGGAAPDRACRWQGGGGAVPIDALDAATLADLWRGRAAA